MYTFKIMRNGMVVFVYTTNTMSCIMFHIPDRIFQHKMCGFLKHDDCNFKQHLTGNTRNKFPVDHGNFNLSNSVQCHFSDWVQIGFRLGSDFQIGFSDFRLLSHLGWNI